VPPVGLKAGEVLSDRFVVERLAGSGGMGVVHRGTDLVTREAVALKVMARLGPSHANRFVREATVLAELSHPSIVRYVAHGGTRRRDVHKEHATDRVARRDVASSLPSGKSPAADPLALACPSYAKPCA
jgi:serine/threonine protein kinase